MGQCYMHLLIPVSKACRPTGHAVAQFLEPVIQNGYVGDDYQIGFSSVGTVEPRLEKRLDPFTGKLVKRKTPSRQQGPGQPMSAVSEIIALAETTEEFDVFITSTLRPRSPLLEIGSRAQDGKWHPWLEAYGLDLYFHVRNSPVRVCCEIDGGVDVLSANYWNPVDENCSESDVVGLFSHPESCDPIPIPNAGCARAWIEVILGKWLYPRLNRSSIHR